MMRGFISAILLSAAGLLLMSSLVAGQCPTLPSGYCFVDCTRSVYRIVCENAAVFAKDIIVYQDSAQRFELYVWNSRDMTRLTASTMTPVKDQLVRLDLDNLVSLMRFPELRKMQMLKHLTIMNSPLLTELPVELLPESIITLNLHEVGITELVNDFEEIPALGNLTKFSFSGGNITFVQGDFFKVFTRLTHVRLRNNVFYSDQGYGSILASDHPLEEVEVIQNDMSHVAYHVQRLVIETTFGSITMANGGHLDFSDNGLPITDGAIRKFSHCSNVSFFAIRNNRFEDYISLTDVFKDFNQLRYLDMSGTNLLKSKGMLAGVPNLQELHIANNTFRELSSVNIFAGCNATNLQLVDLSNNHLQYLPPGLVPIAQTVTILNVSHNDLDLAAIHIQQEPTATFRAFPELINLDLSFNHLNVLNSTYLSNLTKLEILNISCNNFTYISKDFFTDLPETLQILNLSFCKYSESEAPIFDSDAFSTLPSIQTLMMSGGYLKINIFDVFLKANIPALVNLDLSHNVISDIPNNDILRTLATLKSLRLRDNLLQSVGAGALAILVSLEELDLSNNEISSVGVHDFEGLKNLRLLSLSGNNIVAVDPEVLQPLSNLKNFYFGRNHFGDVKPIFGSGGTSVKHLALQYIPVPCLDQGIFSQLKQLKWIYMNYSLPVYVDLGSFRNIREEIATDPPDPEYFRKTTLEEQGCAAEYLYSKDTDASIRVLVEDKLNQVAQHVLLALPICHNTRNRHLRKLVTTLICQERFEWVAATQEAGPHTEIEDGQ